MMNPIVRDIIMISLRCSKPGQFREDAEIVDC
jgi:hypothetical protein